VIFQRPIKSSLTAAAGFKKEEGLTPIRLAPRTSQEIEVGLLTGGFDRPYVYGLAMALVAKGICVDLVGNAAVDAPEMHQNPRVNFLNMYWDPRQPASLLGKIGRVLAFYARLLRYTSIARPRIFHILWNNKIQLFDRTLLMLYYKLMGKRIVLTAHNVNAARRDTNDSMLNRLSLKIQYRLADHIFVHTDKMKSELLEQFGKHGGAVTVIPFGINNAVPNTELTPAEAKRQLGIGPREKTVLFFGAIRPYKGVEHLVAAFDRVASTHEDYRLIIAGEPKKGSERYLREIQEMVQRSSCRERIVQRITYIPDEQTELYFKGADVLALPYTEVFQSGVLFLAYSYGLPVIASDVGSFRDDIVAGKTGYVCRPCDSQDLARTIEDYFESDLFKGLDQRRREIQDHANARNSWNTVGETTYNVYRKLLGRQPAHLDCLAGEN
jgi:glycosyltransferase involved in cell wall biosynthesis